MQFRLLGPPGIYDDVRRRSVRLTSPKQRVLLGALLVRMATPVPTEELINELWGRHAPKKAGNALQAHASRLRQQLIAVEPFGANAPRLVAQGPGYLLHVHPQELDSVHFRLHVSRAQRLLESDPHAAGELLRKALSLWRGPALEGGCQGPLCGGAAARLEEERLLALEDLYEALLRLGLHHQVAGELEELVTAHPLRNRFRDQLALSLQRCGRHNEAQKARDIERRRPSGETDADEMRLRTASVRLLREAGSGRPGHEPTGRSVAELHDEADLAELYGPQDEELVRLRRRIDQLTSEQHALRSELDRLMVRGDKDTSARGRDSA